jgi:hypothetical protein
VILGMWPMAVPFDLVHRTNAVADPGRIQAVTTCWMSLRDFGASFSGEHGIGRAGQAAYDHRAPALIQQYSAAIAALFARMPAAAVRFGPPLS